MIKTTVVIPNFNGIKYIEDCLISVLSSSVDVNVIVVDNNSTDGSRELVMRSFPMVRTICMDKNTGFCHAVNVGISNSNTEFVMLLNNDAIVEKEAIELLEKDLELRPKVWAAQAKMVRMSNHDIIDSAGDYYCALGWAYALGKDKPAGLYTGKKMIFSACGGAALYRRCVFDEIGKFDEAHFAYLEDVDMGYRANIFGYKSMADMDAVVYHAGSGSSGSRYNEFKIRHSSRNSVYLIYKNMPLGQIILNLPFLTIGYLIKIAFFTLKGFGKVYVRGLFEGFGLCMKKKDTSARIRFKAGRLSTYIALEILLVVNVLRRFVTIQ